jgi:hypothetical protein
MKLAVIVFLSFIIAIASAEQMTPDQVAREIIRSMPAGAYNPLDKSEEELLRAQIINSRLTLQHLMLTSETSEKMRICFALLLIDQQLEVIKSTAAYSSKREEFISKQKILARRLRELNK